MSTGQVVPDGLGVAPPAPARPSAGRLHWLTAAVFGVLAAATLAIGENGGVDLSGLSERRLIEGYLDAWYGGDYDSAAGLKAPQRLRTGPSEDRARAEVAYQAMLGAEIDLRGCERLPPTTIRCEVSYSNALNRAVGAERALVPQQFGIESGMISFVAGPYLEDEVMTASFREFARLHHPGRYEAECVDEPNYQSARCARFKLAHLDEWAEWHRMR